MTRRTISSLAAILVSLTLAPSASAALITEASGEVNLRIDAIFGEEGIAETFPVAFPESQTRRLTEGEIVDGLETIQGLSEVSYQFQNTEAGAVLNASAVSDNTDGAGSDFGTASLLFEFVTIRPARFTFTARVEDIPSEFIASLDDIDATASVDLFSEFSGTFPINRGAGGSPIGFGTFTESGVLAPGTHTFAVTALGGVGRTGTIFETAGSATLELIAIPEPSSALLALSVTALAALTRRRQPRPRPTTA